MVVGHAQASVCVCVSVCVRDGPTFTASFKQLSQPDVLYSNVSCLQNQLLSVGLFNGKDVVLGLPADGAHLGYLGEVDCPFLLFAL